MDASCGQGQQPAQLYSGGMRPLSLTAVLRVGDAWGLGRKHVYDQMGERWIAGQKKNTCLAIGHTWAHPLLFPEPLSHGKQTPPFFHILWILFSLPNLYWNLCSSEESISPHPSFFHISYHKVRWKGWYLLCSRFPPYPSSAHRPAPLHRCVKMPLRLTVPCLWCPLPPTWLVPTVLWRF